jgi:hypothetical protein
MTMKNYVVIYRDGNGKTVESRYSTPKEAVSAENALRSNGVWAWIEIEVR